jgi:hypothetical protein
MTWKGISPIVKVLEAVYATGVKVAKKAFSQLKERLASNPLLPKWDVVIAPATR